MASRRFVVLFLDWMAENTIECPLYFSSCHENGLSGDASSRIPICTKKRQEISFKPRLKVRGTYWLESWVSPKTSGWEQIPYRKLKGIASHSMVNNLTLVQRLMIAYKHISPLYFVGGFGGGGVDPRSRKWGSMYRRNGSPMTGGDNFFCNLILFAICTSTFSKLCRLIDVYSGM
jgi:hypothetical protein